MSATLRRRAVLIAGAMGATAAAAHWYRPTKHLADQWPKIELESIFPGKFGLWRTDNSMPVVIPAPDTDALLKRIYSQTLSRTYVNSVGQRIMLSVAYGGDQSDATRAHRPEVCYPAQGFQTTSSEAGVLPLGVGRLTVRRLVAKQGHRIEPISYWIVVGDEAVISGTEQKLAQIQFGTRGLIPDGTLVRVSSIDANAAAAFESQGAFVADLFAAVHPQWRPRLFGRAAAG